MTGPAAGPAALVAPDDTWTVAIHTTADGDEPVGAGVVLDAFRVLTCAHVVAPGGRQRTGLWVSFPVAPVREVERRRVAGWRLPDDTAREDVAVLTLDLPVPDGVTAAPLRRPRPGDLVGDAWWALGFPNSDPLGNAARGTVGAALAYGWVRLDAVDRYHVEPGFSGGGLWSQRYRAVVGLVGQARGDGDGRALTLFQADLSLPEEKLGALTEQHVAEAAGEDALASWGWALAADPEGVRHWRPRSRGVSVDSEAGYRFRGRTSALTEIVAWLDRPVPDRRVLVVTGMPGAGKSAVLGRIVTTADPGIRATLPADDAAVKATGSSVQCAVHATSKTALEVAAEIARAASVAMPERVEDLAPALRAALGDSGFAPRCNIVIDALDEAVTPQEARAIARGIVLPLVQTCAEVGVQVVVGSRRRDGDGDLLADFADAAQIIDLDQERYLAIEDLAAYAEATLQLRGTDRPDNPYNDPVVAAPVAERIASLAGRNFLIAGLIARTHGLYDDQPVDPATLTSTPSVDQALDAYLDRLPPVAAVPARDLLTALSFAQAPGFTLELWQAAAASLGSTVDIGALTTFARSAAANFLVESGHDEKARAYRLFHQALNDALLHRRADVHDRAEDERAVTTALYEYGRRSRGDGVPVYLLHALPDHAARAHLVDLLLADNDYLLRADLSRLIPVADHAATAVGRDRARLLRLTPDAIDAPPAGRADMFAVTEAVEQLGGPPFAGSGAFSIRWAKARPRAEMVVLHGHVGAARALCAVRVRGRDLLASGGYDRTVRIWDPDTGRLQREFDSRTGAVRALCAVGVGDRDLLAVAGTSRTVRIYDPVTGVGQHHLDGHAATVTALCAIRVGERALLASASYDGTVRIWDPATGTQQRHLTGHTDRVAALCAVRVGVGELLASTGYDQTVRIWDPADGTQEEQYEMSSAGVALCATPAGGRDLLACAGYDGTVRVWDVHTRTELPQSEGGLAEGGLAEGGLAEGSAVSALAATGDGLVASADYDGTLRIWDPISGAHQHELVGHTDRVTALCAVRVGGRDRLASAGNDGTVRVWDRAAEARQHRPDGQIVRVNAVCAVGGGGRDLVATGGYDGTVRVWDPATGAHRHELGGHRERVTALCALAAGGHDVLASGGYDGTVRIWDPTTGVQQHRLDGHTAGVTALCAIPLGGHVSLASVGDDFTVRIWDPVTGEQQSRLDGHTGSIRSLCAVRAGGRDVLASAGYDGAVRMWDAASGARMRQFDDYAGSVRVLCAVRVDGRDLLAAAGYDGTIRICDPVTGGLQVQLDGHTQRINALCAANVVGHHVLVSAGDDRTVRIWDPATAACRLRIAVHQPVNHCTVAGGVIVVALETGLLALEPLHRP